MATRRTQTVMRDTSALRVSTTFGGTLVPLLSRQKAGAPEPRNPALDRYDLFVVVQAADDDAALNEVEKAMQRRDQMWVRYDVVRISAVSALCAEAAEPANPGEALLLPGNIWLWRRWRELDVWRSYVRRFLAGWSDAYVASVQAERLRLRTAGLRDADG